MGVLSGFLLTVGATIVAALLGSAASISAAEFYGRLAKPTWAPSTGVFGPVWTVLYIMIAVAGWQIYRSDPPNVRVLLGLFVAQLFLNALWSWTFFKWESGAGSMATIVALWIAILVVIIGFWRVSPLAGALMLPYLAWVSFAGVLNAALWRMNPTLL
jgi:tryptophan-rich sensory protein